MSVSLLLMTGCKDDETSTPDSNPDLINNSQLKAQIDGNSFVSSIVSASRIGGLMNITGVSGKRTLTMTMSQDIGEGNYSLDDAFNVVALSDANNTTDSYSSNRGHSDAGTIRINSIDEVNKRIEGSFDAVLRNANGDEVIITNGEILNVSYVGAVTTGGGGNSFSARINGTPWTPESITGVSNAGILGVTGIGNNPAQSMILFLPEDVQAGTYNLMPFGNYDAQYQTGTGANIKINTVIDGMVTVDSHDRSAKNIKGNFSFNASEVGSLMPTTTSITEGVFDVNY